MCAILLWKHPTRLWCCNVLAYKPLVTTVSPVGKQVGSVHTGITLLDPKGSMFATVLQQHPQHNSPCCRWKSLQYYLSVAAGGTTIMTVKAAPASP